MLIAETVRLIEADGPLDDAEAMRLAAHAPGGREDKLLARAAALGARLGLQDEIQAWRARAVLIWPMLALLVFLIGYGLVDKLLGDARTINAVLAFVAALGVHFVSLVLWILSLGLAGTAFSSRLARLSLGNLSLWLAQRLSGTQGGDKGKLATAALAILERSRTMPWLLGLISHVVWAGAFLLALAGLWLMFSFREYRLTWETTIQGSEFFIRFIEVTGALPRSIGFPTPDAAILTGADFAARDRAVAFWLMGATFTYGLLPRVVLALLSWAVVARRRARLALDMTDPYFRKLQARIDEIGRTQLVDPERAHQPWPDVPDRPLPSAQQGRALVGFELPPESAWPPAGLDLDIQLSLNLSGAANESSAALDRLSSVAPSRILFVCDQAASPDRGTARFLRQAAACGEQAAILLLPVRAAATQEPWVRRWQDWLAEGGLGALQVFDDAARAAAWVETRNG